MCGKIKLAVEFATQIGQCTRKFFEYAPFKALAIGEYHGRQCQQGDFDW